MNAQLRTTGIVAIAFASVFMTSGCSRTTGRHIDVSAGQYYSEDEYAQLSGKEKENYCSALQGELGKLQGKVDARKAELTTTRKQIESLRNQIEPIEKDLLRIDSDIRTLSSQVAEYEALPKTWTIKPGECLWIISGYDQVYADPVKWPRIFRANTDKIQDPYWIYPDTVLVIPRDWPHSHKVVQDESLSIIASYWEVYGNPMDWTKIYEANKDKIADPNLIQPNEVLTIPRQED